MKSLYCLLITFMGLQTSFPPVPEVEKLMFRHYKVEDGLSSNTIQCITQDSRGFIWIGTSDGLNRFDSFDFKVYRYAIGDSSSLLNNSVNTMHEDGGHLWIGTDEGVFVYDQESERFKAFALKTDGLIDLHAPVFSITGGGANDDIWIATVGQGLFRYDKISGRVFQYKNSPNDRKSISSDYITKLLIDRDGQLWIATTAEGLNVYDPGGDNFVRIPVTCNEGGLHEPSAFALYEDSSGNIWVGGWEKGLIRYDKKRKRFFDYLSGDIRHIHSICEFSPGQLMVGSDDGLTFLSIATGKGATVAFNPFDIRGLNDNFVYPIFKDREGGVWIGTYFGGINYLRPNYAAFACYSFSPEKDALSGRVISRFCDDNQGRIWIGTDDGGLNRFDVKDCTFKRVYLDDKDGIPQNIHALHLDGDHLWVGTFNRGLYKLDTRNGTFKKYTKESSIRSLDSPSIYSVFRDRSGNLWIGTKLGINLYNYGTDDFTRVQEIGWGSDVVDIVEDNCGFIWFASQRKGVYKYNPETKEFSNYLNNSGSRFSIPDNRVNCLCFDDENRLWIGTASAGLCVLDKEKNAFVQIKSRDYSFDSAIYAIISDGDDLWITTNKGLVRFNVRTNKINIYNLFDGLQSNQFNPNSGIKAASGEMYIGGVNGFNVFNPSLIKDNAYIPPVVFTNFQLFNKNVPIEDNSVLTKSIGSTEALTLSSKQSNFSIKFIALSYCTPMKNQYAYMMEGFDKDWITLQEYDHKVTYTNLPPGNYVFRVKASNNDGIWNEAGNSLRLTVTPPWWKSEIMIAAYFFIVIGLVLSIYVFLLKRETRVHDKKLKEMENEKERELLDAKLHFFTHIAHEIRTPVTLISAPIENILLNTKSTIPSEIREDLNIIQKNSNRLLHLVNQLLGLRKIEQSINQFSYRIININVLLEQTINLFRPLAEQNGIRIHISKTDPVTANTDPEALTKILSNLLTNAVKYTDDEIDVTLDNRDDNSFGITIRDNGVGINPGEKEKIFSPFYNGGASPKGGIKGFGIGLSLVKLLVEKLNGSIDVESVPEKYSIFTVRMPVGEITDRAQDATLSFDSDDILTAGDDYRDAHKETRNETRGMTEEKQESLLVVEDNADFGRFLKSNFDNGFNVFLTKNGTEAIHVLLKHRIDIVISDIVMPEMNGIEMCRIIKQDVRLSHIPVILLTARTETGAKIEGLETGADVYIEKPLSMQYLRAQVKSLLLNRKTLHERFSDTPFVPLNSIAITKTDEELLKKINEVIEKNIANSEFSVDDIANSVHMSRSVLYIKIKAVAGLTPNDFVRLVRLRKAAEYLAQGECRINEVCYLTGFNSPSYFSKCFQKQFGVLPKDFAHKDRMKAW